MKTLRAYLEQKYSPTCFGSYETSIKRYCLIMRDKAENATYTDVLNYIGLLRETKNARTGKSPHPKTLRNNLFAIKIYYRYLILIGKRKDHPCQNLHLKDQINKQIQVESLYPKETLTNLYENWKSKNPLHQRRDKIMISLLIYQALMPQEIIQLKTTDIDLENATLTIKGSVKNKARTLILQANQILLFHTYLKQDYKLFQHQQKPSKRQDYLLLSDEGLQLWQGTINRTINLEREKQHKLTPFKIRQSVIAQLLKNENDLRIVQEFAGHRRTSSTEAYKQTGLEELKSAIEKLHPLQ
jgi:site-specific recombinase XerD